MPHYACMSCMWHLHLPETGDWGQDHATMILTIGRGDYVLDKYSLQGKTPMPCYIQ